LMVPPSLTFFGFFGEVCVKRKSLYLGFRSIGNRSLSLKENYQSMARLMRDGLQQVGAVWTMENFLPVEKAKK
jgi:hypothetical protein